MKGDVGFISDMLHHEGHRFQQCVWAYLWRRFGYAECKWKGLPDIQVEVNGVKLNLEVTISRSGFWWKIAEYKERGVPLHAIIVIDSETDIKTDSVRIIGFDENLPTKLEETAAQLNG